MADTNAGTVRSFEWGSVIEIGSTPDIIKTAVEDGWSQEDAVPETFETRDRQQLTKVLQVYEPTGMFRLTLRDTNTIEALETAMRGTGANGEVGKTDITLKIPEYRGASTGESRAFTGCYLAEPVRITSNGREGDTREYVFKHDAMKPTIGSYGS